MVVIVPTTLRPIRIPEINSALCEISCRFTTSSSIPEAISIARSITAPEEDKKIAPT